MPGRKIVAAALLLAVVLTTACGTARRTTRETQPTREGIVVAGRFIAAPVMRIGLEGAAGTVVTVKAPGGIALVSLPEGKRVAPDKPLGQVSFFVAEVSAGVSGEIHRVQIASLRNKQQAEKLAADVRRKLDLTVVVRFSSQTRTWRVQAGEAASRTQAAAIEKKLRAAGYAETWVVRDAAAPVSGGTISAVDASGRRIAASAIFRCAPRGGDSLLESSGSRYRGALELRVSREGRIIPVNIVNLDDYLCGVVPVEMSPTVFPQLEALKAQAVAARTYAYKNRGQYSAEGYDICESARCQVYNGAGVEHELTDRAVRQTAGEVITYGGEPVNALFTSTCGGHTEDAANIFPGDEVAYLKGVVCEPEAELFSSVASEDEPGITYGADGLPLDLELAALKTLGVVERDFQAQPREGLSGRQWSLWLEKAAARLGLRQADSVPQLPDDPDLKEAIVAAATAVGWLERIDRQVTDGDLMILADFEGVGAIDPAAARAALYFLRLGLIGPEPDGRLAFGDPLGQTAALRMLHRLLRHEAARGIIAGRLVRVESGRVVLRRKEAVEQHTLGAGARLFKRFQEYTVPVRSLQMAPGDELILFLRDNKEVGALVHSPSLEGIASDRSSRYFQWDVQYSPEELREKIKRYADVGPIVELRPLRYGVSERIVELEVVGGEGRAVLKGLQIRWALGLRENLFVIEKRYGERGLVETWRFIGKGWGHGVGLCQVGASGMAIAGKSYSEILRHYYTGVEVEKLY